MVDLGSVHIESHMYFLLGDFLESNKEKSLQQSLEHEESSHSNITKYHELHRYNPAYCVLDFPDSHDNNETLPYGENLE